MSKIVLNPLVAKLYEALKKRKVSVPKLAAATGIDKDRIYKWKQEGTKPKADDAAIINRWIDTGAVEKSPNKYINHDGPSMVEDGDGYLAPYIDSLKEQKRILEVQNDFLRRNFETSLNSIAEGQLVANSQLKALGWYNAVVATGGDEKKAQEELVRINNKAAFYAGVDGKGSKTSDRGRKNRPGQ